MLNNYANDKKLSKPLLAADG